jgi:hypothetical protein
MVTWRHRDGSVTVEPVVGWRFDQAMVTNADGQLSPISFRDREAGILVWHSDMEYGLPDGTVLSGRDVYKGRS